MQTFLPLPDYRASADVLDLRRLGKQVIEAGQIMRALFNPDYGWQSHPATRMWRGHPAALLHYTDQMHAEWQHRRHHPHAAYANLLAWLTQRGVNLRKVRPGVGQPVAFDFPAWHGNDAFHASHRSNLLRKVPDYYGKYGWTEPHDLPYVWPKEAPYVLP